MILLKKSSLTILLFCLLTHTLRAACPSNCQECTSTGLCTTCNIGYYLNYVNNQCSQCFEHCDVCTNSNSCITCSDGYSNGTVNNRPACINTIFFFSMFFGIFGLVICILCASKIYSCCKRNREQHGVIVGPTNGLDYSQGQLSQNTQFNTAPATGHYYQPPPYQPQPYQPPQYHSAPYQPPLAPPPFGNADNRQQAKPDTTSYPRQ